MTALPFALNGAPATETEEERPATHRMVKIGTMGTSEIHEALPPAMREAVDEFGLHLARVDNRSAHTVRAYLGDVVSLLDHAARDDCATPADLDITVLRGWLAQRMTDGAARTSQARAGRGRAHLHGLGAPDRAQRRRTPAPSW